MTQHVAILDDEADIRTLIGMLLEPSGVSTSQWANGLDLIAHLRETPVDIVISDLLMPDCDGVEFFAELASLPDHPAMILISGQDARTRQSARQLANEYGVEVIAEFGKPLDTAALETVVTTYMAHKAEPQAETFRVEDALQAGELRAHYQPIFAISERRRLSLSSLEALVRWEHPIAGLLSPGAFLPNITAEDTWLDLTREMLSIVCGQLENWHRVGFRPRIAINIPPVLLANRDLPGLIDRVTRAHGVDPHDLVLELTEDSDFSSILEDKANLMRLKMRGYSISVDDFGVGYSSLKRLQGGLFDQVKIDRSFVSRADRDEDARNILTSTVDLARSLGMSVCAEGIENYEIMCEALRCGCSHLQGFGLARPVNADMLEMQFAPDGPPADVVPGTAHGSAAHGSAAHGPAAHGSSSGEHSEAHAASRTVPITEASAAPVTGSARSCSPSPVCAPFQ